MDRYGRYLVNKQLFGEEGELCTAQKAIAIKLEGLAIGSSMSTPSAGTFNARLIHGPMS